MMSDPNPRPQVPTAAQVAAVRARLQFGATHEWRHPSWPPEGAPPAGSLEDPSAWGPWASMTAPVLLDGTRPVAVLQRLLVGHPQDPDIPPPRSRWTYQLQLERELFPPPAPAVYTVAPDESSEHLLDTLAHLIIQRNL